MIAIDFDPVFGVRLYIVQFDDGTVEEAEEEEIMRTSCPRKAVDRVHDHTKNVDDKRDRFSLHARPQRGHRPPAGTSASAAASQCIRIADHVSFSFPGTHHRGRHAICFTSCQFLGKRSSFSRKLGLAFFRDCDPALAAFQGILNATTDKT